MGVSVFAALGGLALAYVFYVAKPDLPRRLSEQAHALYSLLLHKYYVDEIYDAIIVWPVFQASRDFLWKIVDVVIIDGTVNGLGGTVRFSARVLRHMQSGYVRTYAGWILFGGVMVVAWFLR